MRPIPLSREYSRFTLTPAFAGALVILVLQLFFVLIAGSVGLGALDFSGPSIQIGWFIGAGILATLAMVLAAGAGGYVSGRLARPADRWEAWVHGLSAYGIASLVVAMFVGVGAMVSLSRALTTASIGAGAGSTAIALLNQISEVRVVTDLEILKGKAVTQVVVPHTSASEALNATIREATTGIGVETLGDSSSIPRETREVMNDARRTAVYANVGFLVLMLLGVLAAALGGRVGGAADPRGPGSRPTPLSEASDEELHEAA